MVDFCRFGFFKFEKYMSRICTGHVDIILYQCMNFTMIVVACKTRVNELNVHEAISV